MNEDIFNHLLDVESQAANMLFDAQVQADDVISNTKKEIEEEIKTFHDKIVEEESKRFAKEKEKIDLELRKSIEEYIKSIQNLPLDYQSFALAIDDFFFKTQEK